MKTYIILDNGKAIKCLECDKVSYHPDDVANLYCGFCHKFHEREKLELEKPERFK